MMRRNRMILVSAALAVLTSASWLVPASPAGSAPEGRQQAAEPARMNLFTTVLEGRLQPSGLVTEVPADRELHLRISVSNPSDVAIRAIAVTSDQIPAGDISCPATSLGPSGSMACTATYVAPALGQHDLLTVTATATPAQDAGGTQPAQITKSETLDLLGAAEEPAVRIQSQINGAYSANEPGPEVPSPSTMQLTFVVTNNGNVPLDDVQVVDDAIPAGGIDCPATTLLSREEMVCTAELPAPAPGAQHQDVATVTATPRPGPGGPLPDVTASATAYATGVAAGLARLSVFSSVCCGASDQPPGTPVQYGSTVELSIVVSNTGQVRLDPVVVTDDRIPADRISCPETALDPDAFMFCTATFPAPDTGQVHASTSTATGTPPPDPGGTQPAPVSASHTAYAFVSGLYLDLKVDGIDATNEGSYGVPPGSTLQLTAEVTNFLTVPLDPVVVTGKVLGDPATPVAWTCPSGGLEPFTTMTCTATLAASPVYEEAQIRAHAEGTPPPPTDGSPPPYAFDDDRANVMTVPVAITTSIDGDDADAPPGTWVAEGSTLQVALLVENRTDEAVPFVNVTDGAGTLSSLSCPRTALGPRESMTCTATAPAPALGATVEIRGEVNAGSYSFDRWAMTESAFATTGVAPSTTTTTTTPGSTTTTTPGSSTTTTVAPPVTVSPPGTGTAPISAPSGPSTTSTTALTPTTTAAPTSTTIGETATTAPGTDPTDPSVPPAPSPAPGSPVPPGSPGSPPGTGVAGEQLGRRPAGGLPRTGSAPGPLLALGLTLLAGGAVVGRAGRRRREPARS